MQDIVIQYALPLALTLAFALGFGARQIGLPPLVGFLVAGFILNVLGLRSDEVIQTIADYGVILLLFTIGLKLKVKSLLQPEVWGGASAHALITTGLFSLILMVLAAVGLPLITNLTSAGAVLVAFALSFSSTVFAVKVLEDRGELGTLHGRTAIGILIMQDVFAVIFLTVSQGKIPSVWALALIGLVFLRPLYHYVLDRVGHGELLPLFGFFAALALGVELFGAVGLKPDLGALILGMLLAGHKKASEIADSLFSFKEIFLVGFFLNIGLSDLPSLQSILIGVLLVLLIPIKSVLFYAILTRFKLRGRTSALSASVLSNYSEFGLIVGTVGVTLGIISNEWLVTLAITLSISFVAAAPISSQAHALCARFSTLLERFAREERHAEEALIDTGDAKIAVIGMGRIGSGAYDHLHEVYGDVVVGFDVDPDKVAINREAGRNVLLGDATDMNFWGRHSGRKIDTVLLAMPEHRANLFALDCLRGAQFDGFIGALAQYSDRAEALEAAGANVAYSTYAEAGAGFAAHVESKLAEAGFTVDGSYPSHSAS